MFDRLAKTEDPDEAAGIVGAIERLWLRSGSDTSDLLMSRAVQAMGAENYPLALSLLDTIVQTQPDWAEGWNKRATARYFSGDPKGSMADIAETLKREPAPYRRAVGPGRNSRRRGPARGRVARLSSAGWRWRRITSRWSTPRAA